MWVWALRRGGGVEEKVRVRFGGGCRLLEGWREVSLIDVHKVGIGCSWVGGIRMMMAMMADEEHFGYGWLA